MDRGDLPYFQCTTSDCIHNEDDFCTKGVTISIECHRCIDYAPRTKGTSDIVTIEVRGGLVQNVYASPDLPRLQVELLDFDNLKVESGEALEHGEQQLKLVEQTHNHIL